MVQEHVYRYPRRFTWPLELLSAALVALATFGVGRAVLNLVVRVHGLDRLIRDQAPWLQRTFRWLQQTDGSARGAVGIVPTLGWLLLALLVTQFLRNMLPTVRTSSRGMLVRWSGDWVPLQWQNVQAINITEARKGQRWVALIQTDDEHLTGWHRWYSLLYRLIGRRGFLVTSAMHESEGLLREVMDELGRMVKLGMAAPIAIDDRNGSPLFRLLLGRRAPQTATSKPKAAPAPIARASMSSAPAAPVVPAPPVDRIHAEYRPWLTTTLFGITAVLGGLALWQYIRSLLTFGYYQFPKLRTFALVQHFTQANVESPWGLLLGAHLALAVVGVIVVLLYHIFPTVAADSEGLSVTAWGRTQRFGWDDVRVVKAQSLRGDRHLVLIEAQRRALPWWYRVGSWLYEGGIGRGALVWPMARNFEPLMQRVALELTRQVPTDDSGPRLRDDAPGWLVWLMTRPADALDHLVRDLPYEQAGFDWKRVLRALPTMVWLAVLPGLIFVAYRVLFRGAFSPQAVGALMFMIVWGLMEWPLVSLIAKSLDDIVGAGTKGFAGVYLYPTAQLPRLVPLAGALLLIVLGFPALGWLVWLGGMLWGAVVTAGLWEALYGWRGVPLLAGALPAVVFQVLTLWAVIGLG